MMKRAGLILVPLLAALGAGIAYISGHYGELIHYAMAGAEFAELNCPAPPSELMRDLNAASRRRRSSEGRAPRPGGPSGVWQSGGWPPCRQAGTEDCRPRFYKHRQQRIGFK
jgi:hypothetical protein